MPTINEVTHDTINPQMRDPYDAYPETPNFYTVATPRRDIYAESPLYIGPYNISDGTYSRGRPFSHPGHAWTQDNIIGHLMYDVSDQGEPRPPEYVAWQHNLPSASAAVWAVRQAVERKKANCYRSGQAWPSWLVVLDDEYAQYSECPMPCCYSAPADPNTDGRHGTWCACQACDPCECREPDCELCWPDGYECGCCIPECGYCFPDGYDCDCEEWDCRHCFPDGHPLEMDDQEEPDPWPGLPAMPDPVPGRCRFGVEVEFNANNGGRTRSQLLGPIQRAGIACSDTGYTHEVTRFWKMTTDGTVSGGELVSPIMAGDDFSIEQVREVIRLVKEHGGYTGRNVGLHVHLDITDFYTEQLQMLAVNLRRGQRFLASFVPEHRYDGDENSYGADLLDSYQWDEIYSWLGSVDVRNRRRTNENRVESCPTGRYVSFNFNSLLTYGTVECRLLGHTLNTIKVRTWIRTLQTMLDASRRLVEMPDGDALDWLVAEGLDQAHADHFRSVATTRGNAHWLQVAA